MNKEWAELNRSIQKNIGKKDTFCSAIDELLELRKKLIDALVGLLSELSDGQFSECPFMKANGYHNKTVAYSVWHIFRIEDIVAHSVICDGEQIFFSNGYRDHINASITTTGNELIGQKIVDFSRELNIDDLYDYAFRVRENTDLFIKKLSFGDLRGKPSGNREKIKVNSVSLDANAEWLIDYWFNKDIKGLILMPFSRHWIMHTEAALRIKNKLLTISK